ncbi:MAG: ABC transporter permease subunit [Candidatus Micrarchaeales archaeon]
MDFISTLAIDILASWFRLLFALLVSIIFSIAVGIAAATNRTLERIILPILDVFQTIPILGFFPVVILLVVSVIPNYIGINIAVIFLIFTSMSWNISFGVYESVKAIPQQMQEVVALYRFSLWDRIKKLYVPASLPRIAYQSAISFSIGLFYLATSEIFSTGSKSFAVTNGIGVEIANIAASTSFPITYYLIVIVAFIAAVVLTRIFLLEPFYIFSERFSLAANQVGNKKSRILEFYIKFYSTLRKAFPRLKLRNPTKAVISVKPRTPQIKKSYRLIKHKHFKHIYATIALLLIALGAILLLNTSLLPTEFIVLIALGTSFVRIWITYIICAALAIPVGISIAFSRKWFRPATTLLQVSSAIPATILLPLLIVLLASTPYFGESTAFAVIFISMIWYILFSVISGLRTIPSSLIEVASSNRLNWMQRWSKLYVPAALPSFITGSITAIGGGWNSLIVAEYFVVQSSGSSQVVLSQVGTGIGKLIDVAVFSGNITLMLLSILSMTLMVIIVNRLFWQKVYNRVITRYKLEV